MFLQRRGEEGRKVNERSLRGCLWVKTMIWLLLRWN